MKNFAVIYAIGINIFFLLLYIVFSSCKFASLDDFFMSSVLTGAYGSEYDVHLYFINAAYGWFLKPFYWFSPKIGWYYIFEVLEVFSSLTVFTYFLLKKIDGRIGVVFSFFFLACLSPVFYFQFDFTKNAALLTASGIVLLFDCENEGKKKLVIGVLMLVAGFVMRKEAFLLGVPYLGILFLFRWFHRKKMPITSIISCFVACGIMAFLHFFDRSLYQNSEYQYYADYQQPRAIFVDGNYYDSESIFDEIEESGLYGLNFKFLKNWTLYDTEVFQKDSIQKYIGFIERNKYEFFVSKIPFAVLIEVARSFQKPNVWCWIALYGLLVVFSGRRFCMMQWISLFIVSLSIAYLLIQNRVLDHVVNSIWLYATVCLLPVIDESWLKKVKLSSFVQNAFMICGMVLFGFGFWEMPNYLKNSLFRVESKNDLMWEDFYQFEQKNQDIVFLMEFHPYKAWAKRLNYSYLSLKPGQLKNIFPLGYWNIYLPGMVSAMKNVGIENPMQSFSHKNVYVLQYNEPQMYQDYYKFHLGQDIVYKEIPYTKQNGFDVLKFDLLKYEKKEK